MWSVAVKDVPPRSHAVGEEHPDFELGSSSLADINMKRPHLASGQPAVKDIAQLVWDSVDLLNQH